MRLSLIEEIGLLSQQHPGWLIILITWQILWKGLALWKAARNEDKGWFVAILLINTLGILEVYYLFLRSSKGPDKMD